MKIIKTTLAILLLSITSSFGQTRFVKANDTVRQFTIYASSKINEGEKVPLLLNFHGSGMTALEHMFYTKTNALAEDKGFIVVYPQGINNDWNVGFEQDYDQGTKDVEFIEILLEKLEKYYPIDTSRIYATGLSRGGFFVQRLVAEMPNTIKGFVSVGAPMPNEVKKRMQSAEEVRAMYVHGTADQIVDPNGMEDAYLSVDECMEYWKQRNQIDDIPETQTINKSEDKTSVRIEDYGKLSYITIENGGHTWPNSDPFNVGFPLGKTTQDINFNELLYSFLFE